MKVATIAAVFGVFLLSLVESQRPILHANFTRKRFKVIEVRTEFSLTFEIGTYPWIVALLDVTREYSFFCGGSLVSPKHVLTGADCVKEKRSDEIVALFGAHDLANPFEDGRISLIPQEILLYMNWQSNNAVVDAEIALLSFIMIPITKTIQPITMCAPKVLSSAIEGFFIGWEETSADKERVPKRIEAPISSVECSSEKPLGVESDTNKHFCDDLENGVCFDNSGNGFVVQNEEKYCLQGIVKPTALIEPCDKSKYPAHMGIEMYQTWIEKYVKEAKQLNRLEMCSDPNEEGEPTRRSIEPPTSAQPRLATRLPPTKRIKTTTSGPSRKTPVLTPCFAIDHYYDRVTGEYLKSSCIVQGSFTYATAESTCRGRNMELFVIDDSEIQDLFHEAMTESLINQPGGYVWMNGKKEEGKWWTFNPERNPLFEGTYFINSPTIEGRTSGDSLRYTQQYGPYKAMGVESTAQSWMVCEFYKAPVLDIKLCWKKTEIYDETGSYLKMACIINVGNSYWLASQSCKNSGMKLFIINDSNVESAILKFTTQTQLGHYWVNGRRDLKTKKWFVYDHKKSPVYELIDWIPVENSQNRDNCLLYHSGHGRFLATGHSCATGSWYICEYV